MKVGDIVKQGDRLVKLKGIKRGQLIGVVVDIAANDSRIPPKWQKFLGEKVTVLWSNGKMTENMAENSLEVVNGNA